MLSFLIQQSTQCIVEAGIKLVSQSEKTGTAENTGRYDQQEQVTNWERISAKQAWPQNQLDQSRGNENLLTCQILEWKV